MVKSPRRATKPIEQLALEGDLERDRKGRALEQAVADLRTQNRALHDSLDEAEKRLTLALSIQGEVSPEPIAARKRKQNEATAFLVASDWHVGELVDPRTVNGKNRYNPDIAARRAVKFFQNGLRLVQGARSGVTVDVAVLCLLGDMITGHIHEELVESNTMSPSEEILFCSGLLVQGIDFLLKEGKFKRIIVPCCWGNHGRTTHRRRISTGAKNSFEWLMYHSLSQRYEKDDRVEFVVADGAHIYLDVYGYTLRLHHGDNVQYRGGVGGLGIPLRKATDAWDQFRDADLTVMGHYHQFVDFGYALVNGSLIGFNPYALSIKARFEVPRQAFFLMDRDRGKSLVAPIWVE